MKFSSTIITLFVVTLFLITAQALPATVSQENDGEGGWTNHVSGPGASGNSYSQSSTTITSSDGRSIVSNNTITSTSDAYHKKIDLKFYYASSLIYFFFTYLNQ